ncbi:MAG: hypothetical protein EXX96DRAFT_575355 [Benjaminiella poitrasii]|nr:MAG: hypothetical protein EXX96DRAFT_575355 [Benjaminiella poitrasii]
MLQNTNQKRIRDVLMDEKELSEEKRHARAKIANNQKSTICDFQCAAYFQAQIFDLKLSEVFHSFRYVVIFFCGYDFSPQSKKDLCHIEDHTGSFVEYGALPIVITQDRAQIHLIYATPGRTNDSLAFQPSFVLASDSADRLIARAYKSVDLQTHDIQRTVIILDPNLHILFQYKIPHQKYFPMKMILNCFEQSYNNKGAHI